jgi:hypothetical protein
LKILFQHGDIPYYPNPGAYMVKVIGHQYIPGKGICAMVDIKGTMHNIVTIPIVKEVG